jgi:putative oxidoreductase
MRKQFPAYTIRDWSAAIYLLVFLYTGINKLWFHQEFQATLSRSDILSTHAIVLSWAIPIIEIVISILLFAPPTRKSGVIASLALMTVFTIYIGYMMLFTPDLPCSCGGIISALSWPQHLFLNIFLVLLGLISILPPSRLKLFIAINRRSRKPVEPSRHI